MDNKIYTYYEYNSKHEMAHRQKDIQYIIDDNDCWICISHTYDKDGYPKVARDKKCYRMSRYIYENEFGSIPNDQVVMHICDNPNCINPNHFKLGTNHENIQDRQNKNRGAYGEKNGEAILTEENVHKICKLLEENKIKHIEIAKMFEVHKSTISLITRRIKWKHISQFYNFESKKIKNKIERKQQRDKIKSLYFDKNLSRKQIIELGYTQDIVYKVLRKNIS